MESSDVRLHHNTVPAEHVNAIYAWLRSTAWVYKRRCVDPRNADFRVVATWWELNDPVQQNYADHTTQRLSNLEGRKSAEFLDTIRKHFKPTNNAFDEKYTELRADILIKEPQGVPAWFARLLLSQNIFEDDVKNECINFLKLCFDVANALEGFPRKYGDALSALTMEIIQFQRRRSFFAALKENLLQQPLVLRPFKLGSLPEEFEVKVCEQLLVGKARKVYIGDLPCGSELSSSPLASRTQYSLPGWGDEAYETTYSASQDRERHVSAGLATQVLLVNKRFRKAGVRVLYGSNHFEFVGSPNATLAFLHDRCQNGGFQHPLQLIKTVSQLYNMETLVGAEGVFTPRTRIGHFRRVMSILHHQMTGLRRCTLVISSHWWALSGWKDGAEAVFSQQGLCQTDREQVAEQNAAPYRTPRNFLQNFARLSSGAKKDKRWAGQDVGVKAALRIQGAGQAPERMGLAEELNSIIARNTQERVYDAEDRGCTCNSLEDLSIQDDASQPGQPSKPRSLYDSCMWKAKDDYHSSAPGDVIISANETPKPEKPPKKLPSTLDIEARRAELHHPAPTNRVRVRWMPRDKPEANQIRTVVLEELRTNFEGTQHWVQTEEIHFGEAFDCWDSFSDSNVDWGKVREASQRLSKIQAARKAKKQRQRKNQKQKKMESGNAEV
ncbi:hypothetical protein SLS56_000483 [Neofusicoccum ribis]|uniref:Uncharacterized protein n=1 Tax=Neofusicoccum ribis TaxID=45134 RepID=A0ABR3TED2_9PEZI